MRVSRIVSLMACYWTNDIHPRPLTARNSEGSMEIFLGIVAVVLIVFVYGLAVIGLGLFATWLNACDKEAERLAADEQAARKEVA